MDCLVFLSRGLCTESVSYETGTQIDKLYDDIVCVINKATDQGIPRSKGFKQFWNDTLKHLHKHMKQCRRLWILDGKKKSKRKVQGVPQSQTAAVPRPQEEEETDKSKQAQIEQTCERH